MCTILVVDDERLVLTLLARVLSEAGYEVLQADSAEEALKLSATSNFDLLLTDLRMPGLSGQELALCLLQTRPGLPVIYMSGFCDRAAAGLDALSGASEFLQKPFSRSALLTAVMAVLPERYWPGYSSTMPIAVSA
jgi:DNA-binding NtrC family response regulator